MADLGAIANVSGDNVLLHGGCISGLVYDENGDPTRHRVLSFDRVTGLPSGGAYSQPSAAGAYLIMVSVLYTAREQFVVEFDSGANYNARIYDRVIPI